MLTFAQRCSVTRHHHKQRSNLSQTRSLRSLGNLASAAEQAAAISITRSFAIVFRVDWYAHWHKNTNLPTRDFVGLLATQLNEPQQVAKSLLLNLLATDTFSAAISFVVSPAEQRVAAEPHIGMCRLVAIFFQECLPPYEYLIYAGEQGRKQRAPFTRSAHFRLSAFYRHGTLRVNTHSVVHNHNGNQQLIVPGRRVRGHTRPSQWQEWP